jgi:voltage-gated potassium channel
MISSQFLRLSQPVVVVEKDPSAASAAAARSLPVVQGDALISDTLRQAGIERARSVVSTFPSDADNVYLILECRELRRDIDIITVASDAEAARRMYMAGATRVISPHAVAAEMIAKSAVNPSVVQLMSEVTDASALGENLTQIVVAPESRLVGRRLRELPELGLDVKVIAVRQGEGITLPQGGAFAIEAGMILVVAGSVGQLQSMEQLSRDYVEEGGPSRLGELLRLETCSLTGGYPR